MVWLKPHVLIAARFTFHPSKVSISFTACCWPAPAALHFLLDLWVPAQEQPLLELELELEQWVMYQHPRQQSLQEGRSMGAERLCSKIP